MKCYLNKFVTCLKTVLFWSEFNAALLASIFSGLFFKAMDSLDRQRKLCALLIALQNECKFNSIHRGNKQSPFQYHWLAEILQNLDFYEQCKDIAEVSLEAFELSKDANNGQLDRRKLAPSSVQGMMRNIADGVNKELPQLNKRTKLRGYVWWRITGK